MEVVEEPGRFCGVCKVTYATELELEDHYWSLMHHIKMEKIKKGGPHSCNLCMESSANIIEYGKHLNDDRHKLALSRRAKEGTELLDSFSSQSGWLSKEKGIPPELGQPEGPNFDMEQGYEDPYLNFHRRHQGHQGQGPSVNKHTRSFSQPDIYSEKHPYFDSSHVPKGENVDQWLNWVNRDKDFNKQIWQTKDQYGEFKIPQGRPGHSRTNSEIRHNYNVAERDVGQNTYEEDFYQDYIEDINWADNSFYTGAYEPNYYFQDYGHLNRNSKGQNGKNKRGRRGSFDSNRYINSQKMRYDHRHDFQEDRHERGRGILRKNRGGGRSRSYDYNSSESTSSSDSSLKRRLEIDDSIAPGRTRRRLGLNSNYSPSSSSNSPDIVRGLMNDEANHRPRSRSSSRDRYRGSDPERLEAERPSSRNSDKKVSWSDQQKVSSTTESVVQNFRTKTNEEKEKDHEKPQSPMLPDSSSESELSKTSKITDRGKKKSENVKARTSPRLQRKKNIAKDSTESVLEKAEKLCQKLRNEREKAKQKKQIEEKKKKFEKQQEINEKIETLAEKNKANITGVLEAEIDQLSKKEVQNEFLKSNGSTEYSDYANKQSPESARVAEIHKPQLIPEKLVSVSKPSDSGKKGNTSLTVSERIAQTRADIDSIRAKIESSVNSNLSTGNKSGETVFSPTRQLHGQSDTSLIQGKYIQPSDTTSLLKMVNSPRTTKERNQLAQMLREHAKSQSKLSLPRFNLKFSDLCSNSDRQDEQVNIETLAPSVQLEIANIIEADVKPDLAELEKLLENASADNAELDMNILNDLGISSPARRVASPVVTSPLNTWAEMHTGNEINEGINSPQTSFTSDRDLHLYEDKSVQQQIKRERSSSPVLNLFPRETRGNVDTTRGLSLEDLNVRDPENKEKDKIETKKTRITETGSKSVCRFASSLPVSSERVGSSDLLSASVTLPDSGVRIKQEKPDDEYDRAVSSALRKPDDEYDRAVSSALRKPDDDYDRAVSSALSRAKAFFSKTSADGKLPRSRQNSMDDDSAQGQALDTVDVSSRQTDVDFGRFSPVRRSVHTQNLYRDTELPERDSERCSGQQFENDARSTLEKVTSILDGVPAPKLEAGGDKSSSATPTEPVLKYSLPKEKHLDSSQNSQASILEEVYSVSIQEESVRQEISTVDVKISKLKSLIEEASQELRRCSQEKEKLMEQESSYRTKRLKLLEDSRSSSACSQGTVNAGLLGNLTQMQLDNPVLLKFLMSQRQSDLSSVGGFSNVESGSQPDSEINPQRRCSLTSTTSESIPFSVDNQGNHGSQLFSKSIEAVSGSTDTVASVLSKAMVEKSPGEPKQNENEAVKASFTDKSASINPTNSISMLNRPLERVGFVTLDALMKGDGDIGKLLNKSLESIEKGTIPEGASPLQKQTSNDSVGSLRTVQRERRDSTFSIDTGSDSERKSVSLKYMGTMPEGIDYESIVRQVSQENKNKSLMITVLSSPEAVSNFRRTPDAGSTPVVRPKEGPASLALDTGYKSDGSSKTNSTHTLTHLSDMESQSARSTFSLGEQIKRMCDGQNVDAETPRAEKDDTVVSSSNRIPEPVDTAVKFDGKYLKDLRNSPVKDCYVKLDKYQPDNRSSPKTLMHDVSSPVRKKLKSKKERDQMSRRKQKESFIIPSDTNSEGENESRSLSTSNLPSRLASKSEEDLVQTGSEDRTPRPAEVPEMKRSRSLLDEVQLETETHSDSCEDRTQGASQQQSVVHYRGPPLSVAVIQEFKGDLYVCYNGSEIRRFELQTGRILKELDCSPYLVNCLHVTSIDGRGDILYTGGSCKKLMLFEPQKFSLISTFDLAERLTCLHENWGRLFVGHSDGSISVRSLKTDKELNSFSCTARAISSLGSSSAGMTKMLCLATGDKVIYVLDAITGLLITMLEGHTQPPRCLQVCGENIISGGSDQVLTMHSITSGTLNKMTMCSQAVTHVWCDSSTIYTACCDSVVRTYNFDLKPGEVLQTTGKGIVTYGIVKDRMVIVGKRDGSVEAIPLDKLNRWTCKFGTCGLQFSVFNHLKQHVLSEHTSDKLSQCTYTGCSHLFPKKSSRQEHVLSHLK